MKPIAPASGMPLPLSAGLAVLPLWIEAPLWGAVSTLGVLAWIYTAWRHELDRRPPLPPLVGETYAPLDVAIAWRTAAGEFPAVRRGWVATLTEGDLWLAPLRPLHHLGGDRDHVRIPRLDVVEVRIASETELRIRFVDGEGRSQEARLTHVPQAAMLASALGYVAPDERGSWIV